MSELDASLKFYEKPLFLNLLLLGLNFTLFIFKFIFSLLTNSLALQADAFDNFTDVILVVAGLIGLLYSRKKPTKDFPYGYYKIENIISLIISLIIFLTAYNLIMQSFQEILNFFTGISKEVIVSLPIFIFLVGSLLLSVFLTIYLKIIGKKTKSPIIESEASEKLFDNLISTSVILGFIGAIFNIFILEK